MGLSGNYQLLIYCDDPRHLAEGPAVVFNGVSKHETEKKARDAGWAIQPNGKVRSAIRRGVGKAICPDHIEGMVRGNQRAVETARGD